MKVDQETVKYLQEKVEKPLPGTTPIESERNHENRAFRAANACDAIDNVVLNKKCGPVPDEFYTGVSKAVTEICACLSNQIYKAKKDTDFLLKTAAGETAEIKIFDNKEVEYGATDGVPSAFAVAQFNDTLILGWRGTCSVMDGLADGAIAPVLCSQLGKAKSGILVQSMFASYAGSDLTKWEEKIIGIISKSKKRSRDCDELTSKKINNIVFTGHSLGGALASTAHLFVKAQLGSSACKDNSPWNKLEGINARAVTFAAPMSILDLDEVDLDEVSRNTFSIGLIDSVKTSAVNFMFAMDVVPRGYSQIGYIDDVLTAVLVELMKKGIPKGWDPISLVKGGFVNIISFGIGGGKKKIGEAVTAAVKDRLSRMVPVAVKYRHMSTLLYYGDSDALAPTKVFDNGPGKPSKDETDFTHYTFKSYKLPKGQTYKDMLLEAHSYFPGAFASYTTKDEEEM